MNPDNEKDDLWQLLGRAKEPAVSPFFSRNTLREVRALRQEKAGFAGWMQRQWRWQVPALACALAVVAGTAFFTEHGDEDEHGLIAIAEDVSASPDYEVISDLDELLAWEESSAWIDATFP